MAVKVLILEDNPAAREFLGRVVRESFSDTITIVEAGDLDSARKAVRIAGGAQGYHGVDPFKLILVDLELPDGSGTVEESVTLVRARWPWSEVGAMLAAARSAYLTESKRESLWQPLAAINLGWALVLAGETDEAVPPLEHAVALAPHSAIATHRISVFMFPSP